MVLYFFDWRDRRFLPDNRAFVDKLRISLTPHFSEVKQRARQITVSTVCTPSAERNS
jgi:hypothetical protein